MMRFKSYEYFCLYNREMHIMYMKRKMKLVMNLIKFLYVKP